MRLPTTSDTRSPWYEAFTPQTAPSVWVMASAPEPEPDRAPEAAAEDDGCAEALFDCYNE
jgi:hypothetical protein